MLCILISLLYASLEIEIKQKAGKTRKTRKKHGKAHNIYSHLVSSASPGRLWLTSGAKCSYEKEWGEIK